MFGNIDAGKLSNRMGALTYDLCVQGAIYNNGLADLLDLLPFKEGSLKIADKSGCPVIPVAMVGNSAIFEDHIPRMVPQKVRIRYGQPIYLKELSKEQKKKSGAYVRDVIIEMLRQMQGEEKG